MTDDWEASAIFNSALETGLRSVCILTAGYSINFDLQQLLAFDHIVVHSGDVAGGPSSLHPDVSHRNGELLVRRPLVHNGLMLMESKGLVSREASSVGIQYYASEFAPVFVESLTNEYIMALMERSRWAIETYKNLGANLFQQVFNTAFDRWTSEFQFTALSIGGE